MIQILPEDGEVEEVEGCGLWVGDFLDVLAKHNLFSQQREVWFMSHEAQHYL